MSFVGKVLIQSQDKGFLTRSEWVGGGPVINFAAEYQDG